MRRLLIVSDMHLGRDCKEITGFAEVQRPNPEFDQAFISLLDHYTSARESEWRLVFAGDFIDFVEVVLVPGNKGPLDVRLTFEATTEEITFGLGNEAERSVLKLERTMHYHEALFRRIAHFVREGGEIVLIRGNHDTEFHWRKVQRVFRKNMASFAYAHLKLEVDEAIEIRNAFQDRIIFAPWCYIEPERIYIEHGHQYDVYCSYDHQLYPVSPTNPRRIDTPLFAFTMRYFVNMLNDFAAHNADLWTLKDYFEWLKKRGINGTIYVTKMGFMTGIRMLQYAWRFAYGLVPRYIKEHEKHLAQEARRFGVPKEKLLEVDALHHTPINRNLSELARLLFLDRFALAAGALATALFILVVVDNVWLELLGLFAIAVGAWLINRKMAPRRYLLPGPKQAQAAKKIASILEVPLVVMGHSHVRRYTDVGKGRMYINTGCWLPPLPGHERPSLYHVVVEGTRPELRIFELSTQTPHTADVDVTRPNAGDRGPDAELLEA
jgi:UDP-2,3-diacylglucosamine pyrophosphatase LpxH